MLGHAWMEEAAITEAEVIALADQYVEDLEGADRWQLVETDVYEDERSQSITLYHMPVFNGTAATRVMDTYTIKSEDEYAAKYDYESIEVNIFDGVLSYIP